VSGLLVNFVAELSDKLIAVEVEKRGAVENVVIDALVQNILREALRRWRSDALNDAR
jgi:hypothetical protein